MSCFYNYITGFNYASVILRLLLAVILGGIIGNERGRHGRAAGLRTHILVCLGAAMTSLTSLYLTEELGYGGDIARLSAQVISGIGFIGAGTILTRKSSVITGLTTAAGMWTTATIGIAIGFGFYMAALVATVVCIFSTTVLSRLEKSKKNKVYVYIELENISLVSGVVEKLKQAEKALISFDIIKAKSGYDNNVGILCLINEEFFSTLEQSLVSEKGIVLLIRDIDY